jgi:hypothetical protein
LHSGTALNKFAYKVAYSVRSRGARRGLPRFDRGVRAALESRNACGNIGFEDRKRPVAPCVFAHLLRPLITASTEPPGARGSLVLLCATQASSQIPMKLPIALPIRYQLEIFEAANGSQPVAAWNASTPFHSLHVGDYLNPSVWGRRGFAETALASGTSAPRQICRSSGVRDQRFLHRPHRERPS